MSKPVNLEEYIFINVGDLVLGVPLYGKYWYEVATTGALRFPIEVLAKADKRIQKLIDQATDPASENKTPKGDS